MPCLPVETAKDMLDGCADLTVHVLIEQHRAALSGMMTHLQHGKAHELQAVFSLVPGHAAQGCCRKAAG